jgi:protein TonB
MFTNLIESQSHRKEFKRRSSFFLFTVAAYSVILFGAGIGSIYAYDAQLEAQNNSLVLLDWVPPVKPATEPIQPVRRAPSTTSNSHSSSQPVRPVLYENASNPTKAPDSVSTGPNLIPPAPPNARIGKSVSDPVGTSTGPVCVSCSGTEERVTMDPHTTPPPPPPAPPVKPPSTQKVTSVVLSSKALSLPQPPYPRIAKEAGVHGSVNVQILVSEDGKVLNAQILSGNPMLTFAARDAAMRARFTPTLLNGQPVKIQGIITYNFVLQ